MARRMVQVYADFATDVAAMPVLVGARPAYIGQPVLPWPTPFATSYGAHASGVALEWLRLAVCPSAIVRSIPALGCS
jgi:hypothetical protein